MGAGPSYLGVQLGRCGDLGLAFCLLGNETSWSSRWSGMRSAPDQVIRRGHGRGWGGRKTGRGQKLGKTWLGHLTWGYSRDHLGDLGLTFCSRGGRNSVRYGLATLLGGTAGITLVT